ncbi:hypothetical protein Ahy_A05g022009 isoform A [Arachis hypogaea]|uniref:Ribonuclease H1 N-terminal domain-containing protein n=3 Tax=Arachis hypogaea TaxID=3818 RepID=A0A445CZH9_ARAHY|nr:hypothetical protein Ahy_A05g022009 isoform A [Arachis hypogaea]
MNQEIQKLEQELERCNHCQQLRAQIQSIKKAMEAMKVTQQATLPTPIPMLTTPSEFSQLSVVDHPQNPKPKLIFSEKIPENKTLAEIVKKSTQDKKYYVIYNGPMKGVYDDWAKAAPFTHQPKTIHKGGFLSIEEAKESLKEYEVLHPEQILKRADKAPAQAQRTPVQVRTGMLKNIPTRAEINDKKRVYRSNCRETLNLILNWTLDKRAILGYYPINKEQLTKLVIFPEASPSDTYQFFQYGLIDTILIFDNLNIIKEFPAGFIDAVKKFKNMIDTREPRDISLKFTSSQPIFNEEGECLIPAFQVVFMSVFPGDFQPIEQVQDLSIYSDEGRLASTLARVFERAQKITKESRTRINYKSRNTLIVSSKKNQIESREMRLLVDFESAFYNFSGLLEKLPDGIRRNLCHLLKDKEDHKCQLCASEMSEESNNAEDPTHVGKEEDETSESSINIIVE